MFEPVLPIRTARMILRQYETGDLEGLHGMYGNADVCRYLPWQPMDIEEARAMVGRRVHQGRIETEENPLVLVAVEAQSGKMIGEFMLRLKSSASSQGEIGWGVHPDFQGRGLATEGAAEMLRLGFGELGLHRIEAGSDPRNVASVRVMEHIGMRREATFVDSDLVKGEWVGEVIYAILESEWRSRIAANS